MTADVPGEPATAESPTADQLADVVRFHRQHGDALALVAVEVPGLLVEVAESLAGAAGDIAMAADFLTGRKRAGGVKQFTEATAEALDAGRQELVGDGSGDGADWHGTGAGGRPGVALGDRLGDAASELRRLGAALDRSGHSLASAASQLQRGGAALDRVAPT